jgi:NAD(P)-dependent dehydrogenase (short-subunit alcohol dehydrogenase family)
MPMVAAELLRPDLLRGTSVLVVTASSSVGAHPTKSFGQAVGKTCEQLGSRVHMASVPGPVIPETSKSGGLDMLVVDGAGLFAADGLRACLEGAWDVTGAVVNQAFLPRDPSPSTRRILYLAPAPGAGDSAGAARAGLENLSRTLSTEWARHEITVVTIAPGDGTAAGEVAALCAYLASPAGAYFSGCLLDLSGP